MVLLATPDAAAIASMLKSAKPRSASTVSAVESTVSRVRRIRGSMTLMVAAQGGLVQRHRSVLGYRTVAFYKSPVKEERMAAIRYIVDDVERSIGFYRDLLGFDVEMHPAPGFAALSRGDLRLYLNAPGAGGAGRAGGSPE